MHVIFTYHGPEYNLPKFRQIISTPQSTKEEIISDITTSLYVFIRTHDTHNLQKALQNAKKSPCKFNKKITTDDYLFDPFIKYYIKVTLTFEDNKHNIAIRYRARLSRTDKRNVVIVESQKNPVPSSFSDVQSKIRELENTYFEL